MDEAEDKSDFTGIAQSLIEATGGIVTDQNIDGVVRVFKGIARGCNLRWEEHIANRANLMLAEHKVKCPSCTHPVKVVIRGDGVKVTELH